MEFGFAYFFTGRLVIDDIYVLLSLRVQVYWDISTSDILERRTRSLEVPSTRH